MAEDASPCPSSFGGGGADEGNEGDVLPTTPGLVLLAAELAWFPSSAAAVCGFDELGASPEGWLVRGRAGR